MNLNVERVKTYTTCEKWVMSVLISRVVLQCVTSVFETVNNRETNGQKKHAEHVITRRVIIVPSAAKNVAIFIVLTVQG